MTRSRTFGWKLAWGFVVTVGLTVLLGVSTLVILDRIIKVSTALTEAATRDLLSAETLQRSAERLVSENRAYLLTRDARHLQAMTAAQEESAGLIADTRKVVRSEEERAQLDQIYKAYSDYASAIGSIKD